MNEEFLKLTNAVYKALEYFPESDPLKNRAKDKALSIMESLVSLSDTSGWISFQKEKTKTYILEDIDILLGYLWIAKTQKWLNSANYMIIANEYEKLKQSLKPIISIKMAVQGNLDNNPKENENIEPAAPSFSKTENNKEIKTSLSPILKNTEAIKKTPEYIPPRQEKIIDFLGKNEKAQVMDLQKVLPDVTKRTIRRDLDELMSSGKIVRIGDFNQVFYKIKDRV